MPDFADSYVSTAGLGTLTGTAESTVSSGQATVRVGDTSVVAEVVRGLSLAVGDVVLIARQGSRMWVTALLYTTAPPAPEIPNDPAPPPKPATVTGTLVVTPTYTGTFRDGKWRTDDPDVFQGRFGGSAFGRNTGAAFYGTKPQSLSGAAVTKATIRVRRLEAGVYGSQTATLWLVTQASKPAGAPTRTSSTTGPSLAINRETTFTIPDSWAQAMVDGTSGGLAVHVDADSPYMQFAGRASWSPAWTLSITWSRTT
jgi:hypothetical protein